MEIRIEHGRFCRTQRIQAVAETQRMIDGFLEKTPAASVVQFVQTVVDACVSEKIYPEALALVHRYHGVGTPEERAAVVAHVAPLLASETLKHRAFAVDLLLTWKPPSLRSLIEALAADKSKKLREWVKAYIDSQDNALDNQEALDAAVAADHGRTVRSALFEAVRQGDLPGVKYLLANGYSLKDVDAYGSGPLRYARQLEMARFLMDQKCKLTAKNQFEFTPVHYAVGSADADVVRLFLEDNNTPATAEFKDSLPSHVSVDTSVDSLKVLLEHGVDQNALLHRCLTRGSTDASEYLLELGATLSQTQRKQLLGSFHPGNHELVARLYRSKNDTDMLSSLPRHDERAYVMLDKHDIAGPNPLSLLTDAGLPFVKLLEAKGRIHLDRPDTASRVYRNENDDVREYAFQHPQVTLTHPNDFFYVHYFREGASDSCFRGFSPSCLRAVVAGGHLPHLQEAFGTGRAEFSDTLMGVAIQNQTTDYFVTHHVNDFNPFRIVTKDGTRTLLGYALERCPKQLQGLLKNKQIQAYIAEHGLTQDLQVVCEHVEAPLQAGAASEFTDDVAALAKRMKDVDFDVLVEALESGESVRVQGALRALEPGSVHRKTAKIRYLRLIQARLGEGATLEQFEDALPKTDTNAVLKCLHSKNGNVILDLAYHNKKESKRVMDILGAVASRFVDVEEYIATAKKCTDRRQLSELFFERREALRRSFRAETELHPNGWHAKICAALLKDIMHVSFDHSDFDAAQSSVSREFMCVLGAFAFDGEITLDVFQSNVAMDEMFWLLGEIPMVTDRGRGLDVAPSPLSFGKQTYR